MREYPVFIPVRAGYRSAVVTVVNEPRGLAVLLPGGGGAPRSHHFAIWTRAARRLAERGIASVRLEWRGIGDSTGEPQWDLRDVPVDDVVAVTRFAERATGAAQVALAGNCGGARAALDSSLELPESRSLVLILLMPLPKTGVERSIVLKSKSLIRWFPFLRRLAKRLYYGLRWQRLNPVIGRLRRAARATDILLLESYESKEGRLPPFLSFLERERGAHRIELKNLPGGSIRALEHLDRQELVISSVVDWFDRSFSTPAHAASTQPVA